MTLTAAEIRKLTADVVKNLTPDQIQEAAMNLSPALRERLVEALVASLPLDPEVEDAWDEEGERRFQAYLAGEMKAYPAEEAIAVARARLRR
jgi:putative addiction module component (TIGR02574 family)